MHWLAVHLRPCPTVRRVSSWAPFEHHTPFQCLSSLLWRSSLQTDYSVCHKVLGLIPWWPCELQTTIEPATWSALSQWETQWQMLHYQHFIKTLGDTSISYFTACKVKMSIFHTWTIFMPPCELRGVEELFKPTWQRFKSHSSDGSKQTSDEGFFCFFIWLTEKEKSKYPNLFWSKTLCQPSDVWHLISWKCSKF